MSTDPSTSAGAPPAPAVAAVVTADDAEILRGCLEAIGRQVYGPTRVFVVGGDEEVRRVAADMEASWRPNLRGIYDTMGPGVAHIWALRQRARPEPDALKALIEDGARVDASVAGSKIVDADDPELLVSVGYATDVFDAPYSGLQPGELDQEQYDVIRDVAAVSGTSMLIRRDLFRGLGGIDPLMTQTSAAIDFCQRARLRGGRVVVVPSSVVRYVGPDPAPRWRERAGETRAMIKAYSPLTLLWSLPLAFVVGVVESLLGPFVRRFPLPGLFAAGFWNVFHLPSAVRSRWQARRGRETGDEELFRYQVNGSARLRALYDDLGEWVRARFPEGVLSGFAEAVEAGQQRIRKPAFFVGFIAVVFAFVGTRVIWGQHLPVVGDSLPPPASPSATLSSYAGGWNPAGLGSPEVLHPSVAATALVQFLTMGGGGAAVAVIVLASMLLGVFGTARLLRAWGISSTAGYLAGMVLMGGPALGGAAGNSHWMAIPAMAALPWAVGGALQPWTGTTANRTRRFAGAVLATGVAAVFVPLGLLVPIAALATWALVGVGTRSRALVRAVIAGLAALPLLLPWLLYTDLTGLFADGEPAFWAPGWPAVVLVVVAFVGALLSGDRALAALGAWGGTLAAIGGLAARSGTFGAGEAVELAGQLAAGLGAAVAVGAVLEARTRRRELAGGRSAGVLVGVVAAAALVASTVLVAGPGRAGLPEDRFTGILDFAVPTEGSPSRVLLFGTDLPGTSRALEGLPYRLMVPPHPTTWTAVLNEERLGDDALHSLLTGMLDGSERRAGRALAEFGVGWVVFTEPSQLEQLFEAQLDLVPLRSLDFPVFRNEVPTALAVGSDGLAWTSEGAGYAAPGALPTSVIVASNADDRWGPGSWRQLDWRSEISAPSGSVGFEPYGPRRMMAFASGAWLLILGGAWVFGRARERQ